MKIKRSSWHYKLVDYLSEGAEYTTNLCSYFWELVFRIMIILFMLSSCIFLIYLYFTSMVLVSNSILLLFLVTSIFLPIFAISKFREKFGKVHIKTKYNNILRSYIKAKKEKVCPLIEYVD